MDDGLPLEMHAAVLDRVGRTTLPVLRCVCTSWRDLIDSARRTRMTAVLERIRGSPDMWCDIQASTVQGWAHSCPLAFGENARYTHTCSTQRGCALHYARMALTCGWYNVALWVRAYCLEPHKECANNDAHGCQTSWTYARRVPCDDDLDAYACKRAMLDGDKERLQEWMALGGAWRKNNDLWSWAVRHRNALALDYLTECAGPRALRLPKDAVVAAAAARGHTDLIDSLLGRGFTWSPKACARAAEGGHLDTLRWLRNGGCPWDGTTCEGAAKGGHMHLLRWAHLNGCPLRAEAFVHVAKRGDTDMIAWLRSHQCPLHNNVIAWAARYGHSDAVRYSTKWASRLDWLRTQHECEWAARKAHKEIILLLRANGFQWNSETCTGVAHKGNLDMLQWLRARGCPWSEQTCLVAARGGHLDVLVWLRSQNCPWDPSACALAAADRGHLHVLAWIVDQGCSWDSAACLQRAKRSGRRLLVAWIETLPEPPTPLLE